MSSEDQRSADDERELSRSVWILTVGRFSGASLGRILAPLIGVIAIGLDASIVEVGAVIAVFETAGLVAPAVGWLIDRFGPRLMALVGLSAFAVVTIAAAAASTVFLFGALLAAVGVASVVFESAATAWVATNTGFFERSRWLGRLDLAWPAGLLVGLPVAGLISLWTWRAAFVALGLVAAGSAVRIWRRIPSDRPDHHADERVRWTLAAAKSGLSAIVAFALVGTALQIIVVVFGVWLADEFSFSTAAIGAVGFALGLADLSAGLANIRFTDRIGKSTAAAIGASVLVVAAVGLALTSSVLVLGVIGLIGAIAGHEFALLATKPLLAEIDPENPGLGIGLGFGLGAALRGVGALGGTWLYTRGGMGQVSAVAAVVAVAAALTYLVAVSDPHPEHQ